MSARHGPALRPARSGPGFAPRNVEAHLRAMLPGLRGPMRIAPLGHGDASYRIGFGDRAMLLRVEGTAEPLAGAQASALRREHRILGALAAHGVPVPKTVLVCDDPQVAGRAFYVAALPEGRVFSACSLPGLAPAQRRGVYFALAETLARLHRVDWAAAGLADYAGAGHFFAREVARWNRRLDSQARSGVHQPGLERVGAWLAAHLPAADDSAIHHGDVRLAKLVFDASGSRVIALCGWERAALGHPLADVAQSCLPWQLGQGAAGIRDLDLARHGLPTQAEYLTHYRLCGGHAESVTTFHLVFALFRDALAPPGGGTRLGAALALRALELIDGASV